MFIIPVIDLLNGVVVHAKKGARNHYQAIQSQLTSSSDPLEVAKALLEYYPSQHLYIADLNAIQKTGEHHLQVIQKIAQQHPATKLWVDAGIADLKDLTTWSAHHFNLILGSENFTSLENFEKVSLNLNADFVLSLDFMPHGYQGPLELLTNTQHWPKNVILMSLAKVGSNAGMDLSLLERFIPYANKFNLYAAGGVRNGVDLNLLKNMGIHGALVASALHSKQL
jgi:phosphoribosylformimino-5-aminoimidazole carboxamide ribotide isomerase